LSFSPTTKRFFLLAACAVGAICLLCASGCGGRSGPIRNVVLVSIDTCRADHLSCYGFEKETTPNIDAIAAEGVLFENAVSPVPITLPAHSSMLTGRIPPVHGVHDNSHYELSGENITLAEILKDEGFATGGFVSAFVLDHMFGIAQGFDTYQDSFVKTIHSEFGTERRGDETTKFALRWIDEQKEDEFFLFLHYYDPHIKYDPPEPFARNFRGDPYSGEIAFTDHCIGRVVAKLKEAGLYESTLLIIAGDHGEMLGEHGEEEHSYFIYEGAIKVPLIVKIPGRTGSSRIADAVGLVDIVPTVCGLLGIDVPPDLQGVDLEPLIAGRSGAQNPRFIYCESLWPTQLGANTLLGVTTTDWKYIQTTRPELYHLGDDPGEENNLIETKPQRAAPVARVYRGALEKMLQAQVSGEKRGRVETDREALDRLASLGYTGSSVDEGGLTFDQSRPDPKDLIVLHRDLQKVQALKFENKRQQARAILNRLASDEPHFKVFNLLGEMAHEEGRSTEAAGFYRRALALNGEDYFANTNLGTILAIQGRYADALPYLEKALAIKPGNPTVAQNLEVVRKNLRPKGE